MPEYIQVAGKSKIYIGFPEDDYATVEKIGEQMNDTQLTVNTVFHKVPGDAHGGPEGPEIESQILGQTVTGQLNLSRFDPEVRRKIERHNLFTRDGAVAESEIGALTHRDRSFRVLIFPSRENLIGVGNAGFGATATDDYFARNFVCCTFETPIAIGVGTKFSQLQLSFTAHRAPEGHAVYTRSGSPYEPDEGIIWDYDLTGSPHEPTP